MTRDDDDGWDHDRQSLIEVIGEPKCKSCGVPLVDHIGIQGTCAENSQLRKERDELVELNTALLHTINRVDAEGKAAKVERDEARRMWCEVEAVGNRLSVDDMYRRARTEAKRREWDCYKEEKP